MLKMLDHYTYMSSIKFFHAQIISTTPHSSDGSGRGALGACPPHPRPPYFGLKKLQKEETPAGQTRKKQPPPPQLMIWTRHYIAWKIVGLILPGDEAEDWSWLTLQASVQVKTEEITRHK